jgi:hypothetical protein
MIGVIGGMYIWKQPLQELSGKSPAPEQPTDSRGLAAKDALNDKS